MNTGSDMNTGGLFIACSELIRTKPIIIFVKLTMRDQ